jgi:hypothetical protein
MKRIALISVGILLGLGAFAQERYNSGGGNSKPKSAGFDPKRIVIGGRIGGQLYSGVTGFNISPLIGYELVPNLYAGLSLSYTYTRVKEGSSVMNTATGRYETYATNDHIFSPGVWFRYNLFNSFFVHTQFEYHMASSRWTEAARVSGGTGVEKVKANYTIPTLLVGAGYRLPMTERVSMYFGVYYDVLQQSTEKVITDTRGTNWRVRSPYYGSLNPFIGFGIGL